MQAPYIRPGVIPLPKAKPPVASYDPQRKVAAVANAYYVREVLKAAGYHWDESTKTWQRSNLSVEDFRADYDLLHSVGVDLDAATAALLAPPVKPEPVKAAPVKAEPAPKPSLDAATLTRAREKVLRLAASGRIKDAQDLAELRSIAGLIRQALEVA